MIRAIGSQNSHSNVIGASTNKHRLSDFLSGFLVNAKVLKDFLLTLAFIRLLVKDLNVQLRPKCQQKTKKPKIERSC